MCDRTFLGGVLLITLSACSPQRFFYYPNRVLYHDPDRLGIVQELVSYPSTNGKKLSALWFPAQGTAHGTVVHFHGNFGNISNHFPQALFLTRSGYNVLSFDYQGYGLSEGRPGPVKAVEDGLASLDYAIRRSSALPVAVFGQSLGGSVAIVAAARDPRVRAAVIESAFSGHRSMARVVLGRHVWTWPFYPFVPLFMNTSQDARRWVGRLSPRPVLFLHGDQDQIVPVRMSRELYAQAGEPKRLWIVPGANHLGLRTTTAGTYEKTIVEFLDQSLRSNTEP